MKPLSEQEIEAQRKNFPAWQRKGNELERTWEWKTFMESIGFVNLVAALAEQADHHPDILIQYNKVTLRLSTHDAGGLTERDFALAKACDEISLP